MTKKTVWALLVALAMTGASFSQENPAQDSSTAEKTKRNEIGVNIAPFVSGIMGASTYSPKFSVLYKRVIKEKNAFRVSASFQPDSYYNVGENYGIISYTDSTQLRRYYMNDDRGKLQANAGYEWRRGKKRIKYFWGADLIGGYHKQFSWISDQYYKLEKNYPYPTTTGTDTLYHYTIDTDKPGMIVKTEETQYYYVGLSPFAGLTCPLTKRFILSAQIGFDAYMAFGKYRVDDHANSIYSTSDITMFEFNMPGLVNEVSLNYRF